MSEDERPAWTRAVKESLNHNMLRPFFYQCEPCGGMGLRADEQACCAACLGSGFAGPKGKFLSPDKFEPWAERVWVADGAPAKSLVHELARGDVELHGLRIAYERVAELATAARALLEEDRESEHGEIRRQTRERLERAIDEAGR